MQANAIRTTTMMSSQRMLSQLRATQSDMAKVQEQLSTGKIVNRPSDDAGKVSTIMDLQAKLEATVQHDRNIEHAGSVLNNTEQALADITDILLEAQAIASDQVGINSNADTRKNQATVIDAQIQALLDISNRSYQDVMLFGGQHSQGVDGRIFDETLGGIRYLGADQNLAGDVGLLEPITFNSNGNEALHALSGRVESAVPFSPDATEATRLADLRGAVGEGVRKGQVIVTIDSQSHYVDLADADTLKDVVVRVNDAIGKVDPAAGSLSVASQGLDLTVAGGHSITIREVGSGKTAADLGIVFSTGSSEAGQAVSPKLTESTTLTSLDSSIDWISGLEISQGGLSKVADFSSATTVRDLINVIEQMDMGVRMSINDDANGFNLRSELSGVNLSIGENGGTTASDLGLRTFGNDTRLEDLRFGLGVESVAGQADFAITLHDGSRFEVDIASATTVGQAITAMRDAATSAGLTVGNPGDAGTDINIGLTPVGSGIQIDDGTTGAEDFGVSIVGTSVAADHLGILQKPGSASTLTGKNVAEVRTDSVFTHLINLRDSLKHDDQLGITLAGTNIERAVEDLARIRADVGVRSQRVQQQKERSDDVEIAQKSLLSQIQDADYAEAITRYTQLQQQLQASLRVGANQMQTSLLDFLR